MLYVGICIALVAFALAMLFIPAFKGYRTIIFNGTVAVFGAILPLLSESFAFLQGLDWTKYFGPNVVPWVVLGIGLGGIALRYATKGPVGHK